MIEKLQELIAIPSVSEKGDDHAPYGAETAKALEYVLNLCRDFGFRTKTVRIRQDMQKSAAAMR